MDLTFLEKLKEEQREARIIEEDQYNLENYGERRRVGYNANPLLDAERAAGIGYDEPATAVLTTAASASNASSTAASASNTPKTVYACSICRRVIKGDCAYNLEAHELSCSKMKEKTAMLPVACQY